MGATKRFLARLWSDECGISWFGYALLLALVATGIIVANEMSGDGSGIGFDLPLVGVLVRCPVTEGRNFSVC